MFQVEHEWETSLCKAAERRRLSAASRGLSSGMLALHLRFLPLNQQHISPKVGKVWEEKESV